MVSSISTTSSSSREVGSSHSAKLKGTECIVFLKLQNHVQRIKSQHSNMQHENSTLQPHQLEMINYARSGMKRSDPGRTEIDSAAGTEYLDGCSRCSHEMATSPRNAKRRKGPAHLMRPNLLIVVAILLTTTTSAFLVKASSSSRPMLLSPTYKLNTLSFRSSILSSALKYRNSSTIIDYWEGWYGSGDEKHQHHIDTLTNERRRSKKFAYFTFPWGIGATHSMYENPTTIQPHRREFDQQIKRSRNNPKQASAQKHKRFTIYCDLDGVLVDFERGVRQLFPDIQCPENEEFPIQELKNRRLLWDRIESSDAFFETLPWAPGGKSLWNVIRKLRNRHELHILTGVPSYKESRFEKFRWCQRELHIPVKHVDMAGPLRLHIPGAVFDPESPYQIHHVADIKHKDSRHVCNVITCWSEKKHHESRPGAVLIDDRIDLKEAWERKGGIFIHHRTGDSTGTIKQLIQHSIITEEDLDFDLDELQEAEQSRHDWKSRDDALYIW